VKPSRLGALEDPKLERAWITSLSEGMEQRLKVSSAVIIGEKRLSISSTIRMLVEENRFEKWETKVAPIVALSESQDPESILRKLTALDLLLIIVEV
jgi:hypothetical protein